MSDNGKFGAFVTGFLTGVIAGGITSLLLAPQSGEETRKMIKEKSVEVYEKAEKNFEEAYAQAEASLAEAREKIEELTAQAKEKSSELQEKGQIMFENIVSDVKKIKPEGAEDTPAEEAV